jgi:hypothetical protein
VTTAEEIAVVSQKIYPLISENEQALIRILKEVDGLIDRLRPLFT